MIPIQFLDVVINCLTQTRAGEVNWRSESGDSIFAASFPEYLIKLDKESDNNIRIRLHAKEEAKIDEFQIFQDEDEYEFVEELYSLARRKALNGE